VKPPERLSAEAFADWRLLQQRLKQQLQLIYGEQLAAPAQEQLCNELLHAMALDADSVSDTASIQRVAQASMTSTQGSLWDERDLLLISYGDSLLPEPGSGRSPLQQLKYFLDEHTDGLINGVHLLPFFP
jgi:sucrose phosphorylase